MSYGKRSPTAVVACVLGSLIFYLMTLNFYSLTYVKLMINFFFYGVFMMGVASIVSATCSADIGKARGKKERAVSTVTGIIDGMGQIGAACG